MNTIDTAPTELPLYPKISSIYNKIMQLAIAIVLLIVLLNVWLGSERQYQATVQRHFTFIGHQLAQQIGLSIDALMAQKHHQKTLEQYFAKLATLVTVHDAHLYDDTGQTILSTDNAESIQQLYGISKDEPNSSGQYVPFVVDIHSAKFTGYLRITLVKQKLLTELQHQNYNQQQLTRLMLLFAGFIGFLLTRGFSRFSRQGFRVARVNSPKKG